MKDRISTQISANGAPRYGIYDAQGNLLRYEYIKPEDAPSEAGTPLNKANMLSDSTVEKLWPILSSRPAEPTVNDALNKLAEPAYKIGDIRPTAETLEEPIWLEADGRFIERSDYEELWDVLRTNPQISFLNVGFGTDKILDVSHNDQIWVAVERGENIYTAPTPYGPWTFNRKINDSQGSVSRVVFGSNMFVAVPSSTILHAKYAEDPTSEWTEIDDSFGGYSTIAYFQKSEAFYLFYLIERSGYTSITLDILKVVDGVPVATRYTGPMGYAYSDQGMSTFCASNEDYLAIVFMERDRIFWRAIRYTTDGETFNLMEVNLGHYNNVTSVGFFNGKLYILDSNGISKVDLENQTHERHAWSEYIALPAGYAFGAAYIEDGSVFVNAYKSDSYTMFYCVNIENTEFTQINSGVFKKIFDTKDGVFIFEGQSSENYGIVLSSLTDSTKPIPDIEPQYGIKSYIKALEG